MSDLSKKQCAPCRGGVPPLKGPELDALFAQLDGGWSVVDEHHLEKEYRFDDFRQALDFTNRVGEMGRWCADSARWASSGRHVDHRDRRRVMISM